MKIKLTLYFILIIISQTLYAQPQRTPEQDSAMARLQRKTRADHQEMLNLLNIKELRPGPSGNPQAPNAANRDENKVNQYTLPDPLILKNGKKIKKAADWWQKRRPEIVEDFEREIYGRLPSNIPKVDWKIVAVKDTLIGNQAIREKTLSGVVDNAAYPSLKVEIELLLATPLEAKKPVPVVLEFGFLRSPFGNNAPVTPIGLGAAGEPTWKEQLISRGWGYAIIVPTSIQADNGAGTPVIEAGTSISRLYHTTPFKSFTPWSSQ